MTKMREMMEQMREKSAMERQERALERERERERETQLSQLVRALAEKIDVHGGNLERPPPVPTRQVAAGHVTTASANRGLGWPVSPRGLEPRAARALRAEPRRALEARRAARTARRATWRITISRMRQTPSPKG